MILDDFEYFPAEGKTSQHYVRTFGGSWTYWDVLFELVRILAGSGSVLWDEPAGWTLQGVPVGSHLYHAYPQVRKHYICQSLVFLKFGFLDLTHDSDKQNSSYSDDTSEGLDSWWPSHNLPWFGTAEHSFCSGLSEYIWQVWRVSGAVQFWSWRKLCTTLVRGTFVY